MGKIGTKRTKGFLRAKGPHNPKPKKEQVTSSTYVESEPFSLSPAPKKGEVFKVHMMYKDCKGVEAKTMKEHLKLKKKGYNHKKSKDCKND